MTLYQLTPKHTDLQAGHPGVRRHRGPAAGRCRRQRGDVSAGHTPCRTRCRRYTTACKTVSSTRDRDLVSRLSRAPDDLEEPSQDQEA